MGNAHMRHFAALRDCKEKHSTRKEFQLLREDQLAAAKIPMEGMSNLQRKLKYASHAQGIDN